MTDRNVWQISPSAEGNQPHSPRPFSAFAEQTNIVLLGDPGAGKSHLFRESAAAVGGRFLNARAFLNIPMFPPDAVLFIDGLDERRAGRGDRGTIDAIVQKLFAVAPAKVRISCRGADWLGESDLAAFQPYFDLGGDAVVLGLERLSTTEQRVVLAAQGVTATEAAAFAREAETRGLSDFLENPQNLIMLVEAVKTGSWPATRRDLFEMSTRLLLSETNSEHVRTDGGSLSVDELRDTAGAIFAARLISDVAGISLAELPDDPDVPCYRSLDFLSTTKVQAVLGRRAFEAGPVPESVDYAHRTTAEFLSAGWLAGAIRAGLPLMRVQALMGVDGHPAPELRGLHAWLAVFLPEHAERLIEADPYGVLAYGDAASLAPSSRRHLLEALGQLSQTDPWFRSGHWQSPAIGALARPDMVDAFRALLGSATTNAGLRAVVVDALATGTPLPDLKEDLAVVFTRGESTYAERLYALRALLRLGPDGKKLVVQAYWEKLGQDDSSIRLRGEIIAQLYGEYFGPEDVARLMSETLAAEAEVTSGTLWSIAARVPTPDIPAVLNRFKPIDRESRSTLERRNVWEVASTFERLLVRVLQESGSELDATEALKWLRVRGSFRDSYAGARTTSLGEALSERPGLLRAIAEAFFHTMVVESNRWLTYSEFREATAYAIESELLLEWIIAYLPRAERGSEKEKFLYEVALTLAFGASARAQEIFAELFAWGDTRGELRAVRDGAISCVLPSALLARNTRNTDQDEEIESSESRRREFETNTEAIANGTHLGWLAWAAHVYFGLFRDVDENAIPTERLTDEIGDTNADTAIEGFIAMLQRPDFPTLEVVAALSAEHRLYDWWHALIAGLDERWKRVPTLEGLSDDLLRAPLAIEQNNPTFARGKSTMERRRHHWKTAVLEHRPELARDAYVALAQAMLRKGEQHVEGLRELLNDEPFAPFRANIALQFLREFPNATPFRLDELLRGGLAIPAVQPELLVLARRILSGTVQIDTAQRDLWLVSAYFLSPQEFEAKVESEAQERSGFIFLLRDLSGYERRGDGQQPLGLPVIQLEFLARLAGGLCPEAPFPSGGWWGDKNPWDASEFVRYLVNVISAVPTEGATAALVRLESDDRLGSYRAHIRHGLANQRARWREAEYDRPDWPRTLPALANGSPANASDLHALVVAHLLDVGRRIASSNTDIYKWFWNEDTYGRIESPEPEESCRDVLVGLLKPTLLPLGITIEPEPHMAADRRADISVAMPGRKILCELKRDYHSDVWHAAADQLDRFYTIDPEAKGFGVYGVFWFGHKRSSPIPMPPHGLPQPRSAAEMEKMLRDLIPKENQNRLAVVVIDMSGDR
jgi:hypothetical protein